MSTAIESSPLPGRAAVRSLVEDLVGRSVELGDADPVPNRPSNVVAVYVTDQLTMTAVVVVDLPGAARIGGALGMLPRGGVDDAIDEGDLSGMLRDNTYEVLNVLSATFNVPGAPHVRLYEMYGPNASLPSDVATLATVLGNRLDVVLTIAGYGDAHVSVVVR
ncbi:MAG TPA: hypothetical protein VEV65_05520 [Kineosporiaceae bacterium]|nr:hypothetical protein [Kineosporiaceae bacterium]